MHKYRRINIFGPPCSGKSTLATEIFSHRKKQGKQIELVTEWIKNWAYDGINPRSFDQLYIFASQVQREDLILRSNETIKIVTDSPVLQGLHYAKGVHSLDIILQPVLEAFEDTYPSSNYLILKPNKNYSTIGRYQNYEESEQIGKDLYKLLVNEHSKGTIRHLEIFETVDDLKERLIDAE